MTLFEMVRDRRRHRRSAAETAFVVASVVLLVFSAKWVVPFYPVPLTMQTLAVIGIGLAGGRRAGTTSVVAYLPLGACGLPVFADTSEKGLGLAYMAGPTGEYLAGYLLAAFVAGYLAERVWDRSVRRCAAAALVAPAVVYLPDLAWLGAVLGFDKPILQRGFYPFVPGDILKAPLAAAAFRVTAGRAGPVGAS